MIRAQPTPDIAALILAGGLARRMGGGDKPLRLLAGVPLLGHVLHALQAPGRPLAISANGDPARFAHFGLPVLPDADDTCPGPLAGVLAGLEWAAALKVEALLTTSGDCPLLPPDLARRLAAERPHNGVAYACSGGREHPTIALWPVSLRGALAAYLARGERRMMAFVQATAARAVVWETAPFDPFLNINTPEDLAKAEALLAQRANT